MKSFSSVQFLAVPLLLGSVLGLNGCGGGGGTTSPPITTTSTSSTSTTTSITSTIDDAFNELNRFRVAAGVNPVVWNAQVAKAAENHARYTLTNAANPDSSFHAEDPAKSGYTGVTFVDRITAAGYTNLDSSTEVMSINVATKDPKTMLRGLMNAPYHGLLMLSGTKDVGMSWQSSRFAVFVADFAAKKGEYISIPANEVRMFPCNGIGNILKQSDDDEIPTPIAGRNIGTDPIGTPVYVMGSEGTPLIVSSYELRNMATNEVAAIAKVLGADAADNLRTNQKVLLPNRPLAANTPYRALATGMANGQSFSKTCEFKTGTD